MDTGKTSTFGIPKPMPAATQGQDRERNEDGREEISSNHQLEEALEVPLSDSSESRNCSQQELKQKDLRGFETDGEWLLLMGHGIKMKIIKEGMGATPEPGQRVYLSYVGLLQKSRTPFYAVENAMYCIGASDLVPGLELAARHMKGGEVAVVRCDARFGFGDLEWVAHSEAEANVPPGSALEFEVTLVRLGATEHEFQALGPAQKLEDALVRKNRANQHYVHGDYQRAVRAYQAARNTVSLEQFEEDSLELHQAIKLHIDCGNNLSMCHYKSGDLGKAKEVAIEVLSLNPDNLKALYRAASICISQEEFHEALVVLKRALNIDPKNSELQKLLAKLKSRKEKYKRKEKKVMGSMGSQILDIGCHSSDHPEKSTSSANNDSKTSNNQRGLDKIDSSLLSKVLHLRFLQPHASLLFILLTVLLAIIGGIITFA